MTAQFANEVEMRVVAMYRSGHHAIVQWLIAQLQSTLDVCFSNNVSYETAPLRDQAYPCRGARRGSAYIWNVEDEHLAEVASAMEVDKWHTSRGRAAHTLQCLVLRDPYNMLASRLQHRSSHVSRPHGVLDKWKEYAKEYLGETATLKGIWLPISYNNWFLSGSYRARLLESMGLERSEGPEERVASWGGGSSFDGVSYEGLASSMRVTARWTTLKSHPEYARAFESDPEIRRLTTRMLADGAGCQLLTEIPGSW